MRIMIVWRTIESEWEWSLQRNKQGHSAHLIFFSHLATQPDEKPASPRGLKLQRLAAGFSLSLLFLIWAGSQRSVPVLPVLLPAVQQRQSPHEHVSPQRQRSLLIRETPC
jgi:hypothetical protein